MIHLTEVKKTFGTTTVLSVDKLEIHAATSNVLVGSNGAGKSTLLLLLAGLSKPTAGQVLIDGAVPGSQQAREKLSLAPDQPALFDDLTLEDQLQYISRLNRREEPTKICFDLIEALDAAVLLNKFPRSMSKGQRQKSSLLMATARPFEILLLDEPTSGLDEISQQALLATLQGLATNGKTVISSSHNSELIEQADYQIRIEDGKASYQ